MLEKDSTRTKPQEPRSSAPPALGYLLALQQKIRTSTKHWRTAVEYFSGKVFCQEGGESLHCSLADKTETRIFCSNQLPSSCHQHISETGQ